MAADTKSWEQAAAFALEASEHVVSYARNDHLDLVIPYERHNLAHAYLPDFVAALDDGTNLLVEVKGDEPEKARDKHTAAQRWVEAVTNWGKLGRWRFHVSRDPQALGAEIEELVARSRAKPSG